MAEDSSPELSIILPCYNESGNLPGLLDRYRAVAAKINLELILVDNGSADATLRLMAYLLARPENKFARAVRLERNAGYGGGLKAGLRAARAPAACFSHADLQCPPE